MNEIESARNGIMKTKSNPRAELSEINQYSADSLYRHLLAIHQKAQDYHKLNELTNSFNLYRTYNEVYLRFKKHKNIMEFKHNDNNKFVILKQVSLILFSKISYLNNALSRQKD